MTIVNSGRWYDLRGYDETTGAARGRDGDDWSFDFYIEQKHIGVATGQHPIMRLGA